MAQSNNWFCNAEGYTDMTASLAIRNVDGERGKTMQYRRGEIYYVEPREGETSIGKPALIVSVDEINERVPTVSVLYLARMEREAISTHVTIHPGGGTSIVFCEKVSTLSTARLGNYFATCSSEDMALVEDGICRALGLHVYMSGNDNNDGRAQLERLNQTILDLQHDYEQSQKDNETLREAIAKKESEFASAQGDTRYGDLAAERLAAANGKLELLKSMYDELIDKIAARP